MLSLSMNIILHYLYRDGANTVLRTLYYPLRLAGAGLAGEEQYVGNDEQY